MQGHVKIGPEFFQKAKSDYNNWVWAFARELLQNSWDAGATEIGVAIAPNGNNAIVCTVSDNGCGMDETTLTEKFLCLGSSGKNFNNSVGGFGKAKELIAFCHDSYTIHTNDLIVTGNGGSYTIEKTTTPTKGTSITIVMENPVPGTDARLTELMENFVKFIKLSSYKGTFYLNGHEVKDRLNLGAFRKEFAWCRIHTNKSDENTVIVRLNGMPMFKRYCSYKGCVMVSIDGSSMEYLAANRDGLNSKYSRELEEFITQISINKKSAFKPRKETKRSLWHGYKLAGPCKIDITAQEDRIEEVVTTAVALVKGDEKANVGQAVRRAVEQVMQNVSRLEFHIKDDSGMKIPSYFLPDTFSDYSRALVERWASCLMEIAILTLNTKFFSIGFTFTEPVQAGDETTDTVAEHENGVLYVNPCRIIEKVGKPKAMEKRWVFNSSGNWDLVATAIHEFVHFEGHGEHDECYAGRITELMGLALANRERFGKVFCGRGLVKWN